MGFLKKKLFGWCFWWSSMIFGVFLEVFEVFGFRVSFVQWGF